MNESPSRPHITSLLGEYVGMMLKWLSAPASPVFARLLGAQTNSQVLSKGGGPVVANIAAAFVAWLSWITLLLLAATVCWFVWTSREETVLTDSDGHPLPGRPLYPRARQPCLVAFVICVALGICAATWRITRGDHPVLASIHADIQATRHTSERTATKLNNMAQDMHNVASANLARSTERTLVEIEIIEKERRIDEIRRRIAELAAKVAEKDNVLSQSYKGYEKQEGWGDLGVFAAELIIMQGRDEALSQQRMAENSLKFELDALDRLRKKLAQLKG